MSRWHRIEGVADLPSQAFQSIKIGLRHAMTLEGGGGGQTSTSYSTNVPAFAEPYYHDIMARAGDASKQEYTPYQMGSTFGTSYGDIREDQAGYADQKAQYDKQAGYTEKQRLAAVKSGEDFVTRGQYATEGKTFADDDARRAYVGEQTADRIAAYRPEQIAAYADMANLQTPGQFDEADVLHDSIEKSLKTNVFGDGDGKGNTYASSYTAPGSYTPEQIAGLKESGYTDAEIKSMTSPLTNTYGGDGLDADKQYSYTDNDIKNTYSQSTVGRGVAEYTPAQVASLKAAGYSESDLGIKETGYTARQLVGGDFDAAARAQYTPEYHQGVTDIALREAKAADANRQNELAAQSSMAGAFGGDRQGILEAEQARNYQQLRSDIQTRGNQQAYEAATQQFAADRAARLEAQQLTEGFRQKAAELDLESRKFDQTAKQGKGQMDIQAAIAEEAAKQASQKLSLDQYQAEQSNLQAKQRFDAEAFAQMQQAGQQAASLGLDASKLNEQSAQYGADNYLKMAAANAALAKDKSGLGALQQQTDLSRIGAQADAGAAMRSAEQQRYDMLQTDFAGERDHEQQQIAYMNAILRGLNLPTSTQQVNTGPTGNALGQVAGGGLAALGASQAFGG